MDRAGGGGARRLRIGMGWLGVLVLSLALMPPWSGAAAGPSPGFTANVRISDGTTGFPNHMEPSLVLDSQGRLFVAWREIETQFTIQSPDAFSRSLDGGRTWSTNALLTPLFKYNLDPWLAVDGQDRAYVAQIDFTNNAKGPDGVSVQRSADGVTWGPITNADDTHNIVDKDVMAIAPNGTVYVAYDEIGVTPNDLRFSRSLDGGMTWSPSVSILNPRSDIIVNGIAVNRDGSVSVAWWDFGAGNAMVVTSADGGVTWGRNVRVNDLAGTASGDPSDFFKGSLPTLVANAAGVLFASWADRRTGNLDILVSQSADDGLTWSPPVQVNDDRSGREQWMPALAVDGRGNLHLAWMDNRTGNYNVFYSTSSDGVHWSRNLRVTDAETPSTFVRPGDYLSLTADGSGDVFVAWTDGRSGTLQIEFAEKAVS